VCLSLQGEDKIYFDILLCKQFIVLVAIALIGRKC